MYIERLDLQTINFLFYTASLLIILYLYIYKPKTRCYLSVLLIYLIHNEVFYLAVLFNIFESIPRTFWSAVLRFQEATSLLGIAILFLKEVVNENANIRKH